MSPSNRLDEVIYRAGCLDERARVVRLIEYWRDEASRISRPATRVAIIATLGFLHTDIIKGVKR
jgi:hypothetical protein